MDRDERFALFKQLSELLTGFESLDQTNSTEILERLDEAYGSQSVNSLLSVYHTDVIGAPNLEEAVRVALLSEPYKTLAKQIIMVWYTGQFSAKDGVLKGGYASHYQSGLLWDVIGAHAPGYPNGGYGSWSTPPEELA